MRRRTLVLSSKKEIKLFGNSIAIGKGLQLGEGYSPNIYTCTERELPSEKKPDNNGEGQVNSSGGQKGAAKKEWVVENPHSLTVGEITDLADYNIRLWMDLKDNVRKYGTDDHRVFNRDSLV